MGEIRNFYEILICKYEWMGLVWRLKGTGYNCVYWVWGAADVNGPFGYLQGRNSL